MMQNYPYINKEDKGKKVYKISHEYLVKTEQYIKADDADQAFDLWLEHGVSTTMRYQTM